MFIEACKRLYGLTRTILTVPPLLRSLEDISTSLIQARSIRTRLSSASIVRTFSSTHIFSALFTLTHTDWAQHGICGRGVLLDLVEFYTESGEKPLPYDPWTTHPIPVSDLEACARKQGVTFKQGDILLLRVGFTQKFYAASEVERDSLGGKPETL